MTGLPKATFAMMVACAALAPGLGGCVSGGGSAPVTGAAAPISPPSYAVGDTYTFSPDIAWTVAAIDNGLITWENSRGDTATSTFNPFLPPVQWTSPEGGGWHQITAVDGEIFPLLSGKSFSYKVFGGTDKGRHYELSWSCSVGRMGMVAVPAGRFETIEVTCTSDGITQTYQYAPALGHYVVRLDQATGEPDSKRELLSYRHGNTSERVGPPTTPVYERLGIVAVERLKSALAKLDSESAPVPVTPPPTGPRVLTPLNPSPMPAQTARKAEPRKEAPAKARKEPETRKSKGKEAEHRKAQSARADRGKAAEPQADSPKPTKAKGGYGVQLASFRDRNEAVKAWEQMKNSFGGLLGGMRSIVTEVNLGPDRGVFYRLHAGPMPSFETAEQLCVKLRAQGAETCTPALISP